MKPPYKQLSSLPTELMHETIDTFCDKLWELIPEPKSREMGNNIGMFAQDLYNVIVDCLYACSVVENIEEENNTKTH